MPALSRRDNDLTRYTQPETPRTPIWFRLLMLLALVLVAGFIGSIVGATFGVLTGDRGDHSRGFAIGGMIGVALWLVGTIWGHREACD